MDLSLVPIELIIDELAKRYEHFVFSGVQVLSGSGEDGKIFTVRKWGGNSHTCIGLCGMLSVVITDEHMRNNQLEEGAEHP
jgi:hypothetical protein